MSLVRVQPIAWNAGDSVSVGVKEVTAKTASSAEFDGSAEVYSCDDGNTMSVISFSQDILSTAFSSTLSDVDVTLTGPAGSQFWGVAGYTLIYYPCYGSCAECTGPNNGECQNCKTIANI